jgi:glycine/D-amino acid oxidase-like deaminating enzyme/nitrite reductase/ring-hydroxylating ferredoxin subunit
MSTDSYWLSDSALPRFPKIDGNLKVDVVVVGGGITGATAAYLLKRAGKKVALLERGRCGRGDTGATTAHLTCVADLRLTKLAKVFGRDHAAAVWDAGLAAIDQIEQIIRREDSDCGFRRVPGYLHGTPQQSAAEALAELTAEAELAQELGFEADFQTRAPLFLRPAMRVNAQAIFHPLEYLRLLLEKIDGDGSHVFEQSEATDFVDSSRVKVGDHTVTCDQVIIATHVPLMGNNGLLSATLFQTKLALYSSYAVGGRTEKSAVPPALFWDTADPYHYLRIDPHRGFDYVIYGGGDHKTGQVSDAAPIYAALELELRKIAGKITVDHRWSGQVVETNDGLPLMGELGKQQFVATGYAGNGMTFGTLAGMMACDWVTSRKNPWSQLFDVHRKKIVGGTWNYIKENLDYPYYLLKDRLRAADRLEDLKRGEGKIVKYNGHRVAAHRDDAGKLHMVSPTCTHLGCYVRWNQAEKTWDCPCHGSRFNVAGKVIAGPAEDPLEPQK